MDQEGGNSVPERRKLFPEEEVDECRFRKIGPRWPDIGGTEEFDRNLALSPSAAGVVLGESARHQSQDFDVKRQTEPHEVRSQMIGPRYAVLLQRLA